LTATVREATIRGMGRFSEESTREWDIRRAMQVCRAVLLNHMAEVDMAPPGSFDLVPMQSYRHSLQFAYDQCGVVIRSQREIVRNLHETRSGPYVPKRKRASSAPRSEPSPVP